MKFLEEMVATPLARAVGWTLLHSLWEGAAASLVLAAVLAATRSARARYAAACMAMLATVAAIVFTFVRLMPNIDGLRSGLPLSPVPWDLQTALHPSGPHAGLATVVPWLAPVWIIGVWIFAFAQLASWFSASRLRHRGVCAASERWRLEFARLQTVLRISRPVRLLESCFADVPVVAGHIRPVILMPIGLLSGLPADRSKPSCCTNSRTFAVAIIW